MRHFVAVAEELHFGRAAQRLNMAQPPLSQSIKRLEIELGLELFGRTRREVWLTDAGKVFLGEAKRTLMQAELTRVVTQRAAASEGGRVNVSAIGPALFRLLPPILLAHHAAYPDIEVRLFERSSPAQMKAIMQGEMEIAFVHPSVDLIEGGEKQLVERTKFVAAVPSDWPIASKRPLGLAELAQEPLILAPEREAPSRVAEMLAAFRSVGLIPRIAQEAMHTNTVLSLVAAGMGCALVPGMTALTGRRNVTFLPIVDLPAYLRWELAMVWRPQYMSSAARNFVDIVNAYVEAHPELLDPDAVLLDLA